MRFDLGILVYFENFFNEKTYKIFVNIFGCHCLGTKEY
jgi:hypothetical protein